MFGSFLAKHSSLSPVGKTRYLPRLVALTAELFARCLEEAGDDNLTCLVIRMDAARGSPILRGLLSVCEGSRGKDVRADVVAEMQADAKARSLAGIRGKCVVPCRLANTNSFCFCFQELSSSIQRETTPSAWRCSRPSSTSAGALPTPSVAAPWYGPPSGWPPCRTSPRGTPWRGWSTAG